jgi:hypothetical protein
MESSAQDEIVRARYRLDEPIGSGSQAETFRAVDLALARVVVVKRLTLRRARDWKAVELFERETSVLRGLEHPQIPKLLDAFQEGSSLYLVQELIEGRTLEEEARESSVSEEAAVAIARDVLRVLDFLHQKSPAVVHRDLKPANLIRRPDGSIALVDFGAAQTLSSLAGVNGSTVAGTFGYMAPEQLTGRVTPASDLYALGATLVFSLSGHHPAELEHDRMRLDFRPHVDISEAFARFLERLLEPALEDRFQGPQEALRVLERIQKRRRCEKRLMRRDAERCFVSPSTWIRVRRHGDAVVAEIPPLHDASARWSAAFALLLLAAGAGVAQLSPVGVAVGAPVVLFACARLLRAIRGAHLRIGPRRMVLRRELLGVPYAWSTAPTKSMWLEEEVDVNGDVMSSVSIWCGGERELRLAEGLRGADREWLLETLRAQLLAVRDLAVPIRSRPMDARMRINLLSIRKCRRCCG